MKRQVPRINKGRTRNLTAFPKNYEPAMTFDEIATAMKTNRQTIWVIYARAIEKIRRQLRARPDLFPAIFDHQEPDGDRATFPDWST